MLNVVQQTLKDQIQQKWISHCNISSKGIIHSLFTNSFFCIRKLFRLQCTNKSLITLDLEQVTINGQLRQRDRTMYLEIKDVLLYVKMIL